jgi:hypothetical protein
VCPFEQMGPSTCYRLAGLLLGKSLRILPFANAADLTGTCLPRGLRVATFSRGCRCVDRASRRHRSSRQLFPWAGSSRNHDGALFSFVAARFAFLVVGAFRVSTLDGGRGFDSLTAGARRDRQPSPIYDEKSHRN